MQQYEYGVMMYRARQSIDRDFDRLEDFMKQLDRAGAEGWQIVATFQEQIGYTVILMRPANAPSVRPLTNREMAEIFGDAQA
jgi:hypothetical protein